MGSTNNSEVGSGEVGGDRDDGSSPEKSSCRTLRIFQAKISQKNSGAKRPRGPRSPIKGGSHYGCFLSIDFSLLVIGLFSVQFLWVRSLDEVQQRDASQP